MGAFDDLIPQSPGGATLAPGGAFADLIPAPKTAEPYSGTVLPISRDAQGNISFDPVNAGPIALLNKMLQSAYSGATLPGDVYSGENKLAQLFGAPRQSVPIFSSNGYNPELIRRSLDTAALMLSPNPGVASGDLAIPGETGAAMIAQKPVPPTAEELKTAGGAGYNAARAAGLEIDPSVATDVAARLQNELTQRGMGAGNAPKTHELLTNWANPPAASADAAQGVVRRFITPDDIQALRRNLSNISGENETDQTAGRAAIRGIDSILETLAPKDVLAGPASAEDLATLAETQRQARQNYAAAMRSNAISGDLSRANVGILDRAEAQAASANSGLNLDNVIRQKIRSFLQDPNNIAGFSDAEVQALRDAMQGSIARNTARQIGNRLAGGGGVGSTGIGYLGGHVGGALGGTPGAIFGALIPGAVGASARNLANNMARNSVLGVDAMLRSRAPLYEELLAQQPTFNPALSRDAAVLKLLMPGVLAPMPPVPQAVPGFI